VPDRTALDDACRSLGKNVAVEHEIPALFPLLNPLPPCPICGSDALTPLYEYDVPTPVAINVRRLALVGCERCGVAHSHPLPSAESLRLYYAGDDGWTQRIELAEASLEAKAARKREKRRKNLARISPHIGPPGAALDFGCGPGGFLDLLREHGWTTYGIELAQDRAFAARRHEMLDEIPKEPTFSLIIANHVLEHLAAPAATVEAFARALVLGGHLYVGVPDAGTVDRHQRLRYVANALHIFTYTEAGLCCLFALHGLAFVDAWHRRHSLQLLARRVEESESVPLLPRPLEDLRGALRSYVEPEPAAMPTPSLGRRIAHKLRS
jgi:SAM-dependent methyltransferase